MPNEVISDAFRKIGVVASDEAMTADQLAAGKRELRRLLLGWQNFGTNLWTMTEMAITLTTASSYALTSRALAVHSVRYRNAAGLDMPMSPMTRQRYYDLPNKTSTGIPNAWFYDKQRATGTLYIWQPPAAVTTETLRVTYERPIDTDEDIDVPPEWENAVVWNLAEALAPAYAPDKDVSADAAFWLSTALAADHEGSVFFGEECD
jgi:hypothetical protein